MKHFTSYLKWHGPLKAFGQILQPCFLCLTRSSFCSVYILEWPCGCHLLFSKFVPPSRGQMSALTHQGPSWVAIASLLTSRLILPVLEGTSFYFWLWWKYKKPFCPRSCIFGESGIFITSVEFKGLHETLNGKSHSWQFLTSTLSGSRQSIPFILDIYVQMAMTHPHNWMLMALGRDFIPFPRWKQFIVKILPTFLYLITILLGNFKLHQNPKYDCPIYRELAQSCGKYLLSQQSGGRGWWASVSSVSASQAYIAKPCLERKRKES